MHLTVLLTGFFAVWTSSWHRNSTHACVEATIVSHLDPHAQSQSHDCMLLLRLLMSSDLATCLNGMIAYLTSLTLLNALRQKPLILGRLGRVIHVLLNITLELFLLLKGRLVLWVIGYWRAEIVTCLQMVRVHLHLLVGNDWMIRLSDHLVPFVSIRAIDAFGSLCSSDPRPRSIIRIILYELWRRAIILISRKTVKGSFLFGNLTHCL